MNRYKKELNRQIDAIDTHIACEIEMGCGFCPGWWIERLERLKDPLLEKLAELSHYNSVEDMLYDIKNPLAWVNTGFPDIPA